MTAQQVVDLLNEAVGIDPAAMGAIVKGRVPCAEGFADHPAIQVGDDDAGVLELGPMGLLNGIAAIDGELIEAMYDEGFKTLQGFRLRPKTP